MSPRPPLTRRLPIALAAGALAIATAVTPAVAADDPAEGDQGNWSQQSGNGNDNGSAQQGGNDHWNQQNTGGTGDANQNTGGMGDANQNTGGVGGMGGDGNHQNTGGNGDQGDYKGVVTAQRLALRSAPTRGSQVIRYAHKGDIVSIFCKVPGDKVDGNPLWYLLTDGTWAWGPARYIDNIGPAPRWC
ncbi:hypothetical protein RKD24_004562 [Streptomyces calvus]|jgi:hypothetical protein